MAENDTEPVSRKGVVLVGDEVVLARNHRGEWELPGGRPDLGETPRATIKREVAEETGLDVEVTDHLLTEPFEVVADRWVRIDAYLCRVQGAAVLRPSDEHNEVALFSVNALPGDLPAIYRRAIDVATGGHVAIPREYNSEE